MVVNDLCALTQKIKKGKLILNAKVFGGTKGKRYLDIKFKLEIKQGNGGLEFFAVYKNGVVASCDADYGEDKDH